MNPVEISGTDIEPAWDSIGINRVDFRPQWDGDLVNVFSTVEPVGTEIETEALMKDCAKSIANWILEHRDRFGPQDRFQVIVGWPKSIRESGRQTIKTGGTCADLRKLVEGETEIEMRRGWSNAVFHETE